MNQAKIIKGLTPKETNVLAEIVHSLYAEQGFSDVEAEEIRLPGIENNAMGGIIASLAKKGIVEVEDADINGVSKNFLQLREAFYCVHPRYSKESGVEFIEVKPVALDAEKVDNKAASSKSPDQGTIMNKKQIADATTKELLAYYNANSGKPAIKRFATRAKAEAQCLALKAKAPKAKAKAKATKPASGGTGRGNKPGTQIIRHGCRVGKEDFRSVKQAFEVLDLPMGVHIRFRMELKASGREVFEHEGKKYNFTLLED